MNITFEIFLRLLDNQGLETKDLVEDLDISLRKAQRTIKEIKNSLDSNPSFKKYFELTKNGNRYSINQRFLLSRDQVLVLIKILTASRSLNEKEFPELTQKMLNMLYPEQRELASASIRSEQIAHNYIDNQSDRLEKIGLLEEFIYHQDHISFEYTDHEAFEQAHTETVEMRPIHIFFDNYYFFIVSFLKTTRENRIFRIDWMNKIKKSSVKIPFNYSKHYDHGIETQHEAFGYNGKKTHIVFEFYGYVEYVKDEFPSCRVIKTIDKPNRFPFSVKVLEIEVNYSDGVKLWLLGETTILRVLSPKYIADDIRDTLKEGYERYLE